MLYSFIPNWPYLKRVLPGQLTSILRVELSFVMNTATLFEVEPNSHKFNITVPKENNHIRQPSNASD